MAAEKPLMAGEMDYQNVKGQPVDVDIESGDTLFPGLPVSENERRWGFIQKVYGIVGAQLLLTAVVGSCFALIEPVRNLALTPWFFWLAAIAPFPIMIPLWIYRQKHPHNLFLLAGWTFCLSITTGLACSFSSGAVVAEALILTAIVVLSLTAYTFYAVKKGQDFGFMGPMLFAGLMTLIFWGFIQIFFPLGSAADFVYSLLGALVFSLYIVYDTDSLIKRFSYDEFVWASVNLYLDIINLFLTILRMLDRGR